MTSAAIFHVHSLEREARDRNIEWKLAPLPQVAGDIAMLRQVRANVVETRFFLAGNRRWLYKRTCESEPMPHLQCILLVDDSPHDTEMALHALEDYNLANEVVVLRDGAEALDYLYRRGPFAGRASGQPCVILLDLKMPKVDGLEVLRQLKGDPALKTIPVVMMTSSREEQDVVSSYQLGVNSFVVKPVQFCEFVEAVKQVGAFWGILNEPPPGSECRQVKT